MRRPRVWLALVALALATQAAHAWRRWSRPLDDVYGRYLARFAAVRERLADQDYATLGYLGDAVRAPRMPDDVATGLMFARSALFPRALVVARADLPLVLVNWHGDPSTAPAPGPGYEPLGAPQNGVRLWRRKP